MNSKLSRYLTEALAASGCAVVDYRTAYALRPDIWATPLNAGGDFSYTPEKLDQLLERLGAKLYVVDFADGSSARVAARFAHMLAERIEWLTGRAVRKVRTYEAAKPETAATQAMTPRQKKREAKLRQLAAQEPPTHDCPLLRQILAARAELTQLPGAES